jgi:hypothetical protein
MSAAIRADKSCASTSNWNSDAGSSASAMPAWCANVRP